MSVHDNLIGALLLPFAACGTVTSPSGPELDAADPPPGHELVISARAAFVAIQDGDGPWTAAAADGDVYRARLASERYGVAIGCTEDNLASTVEVFQRTVADGLGVTSRCTGEAAKPIAVSVHGVPLQHSVRIRTATGLTLGDRDGIHAVFERNASTELFAMLLDAEGRTTRLVRVPPFDVTPGIVVVADFSAQGASLEPLPFVVANAGADPVKVQSRVRAGGASYELGRSLVATTFGVPAAGQRRPDDVLEVTATAGSRTASVRFAVPGPAAMTLPAALEADPATLREAPYLRAAFAFTPTVPELAHQHYTVDASTDGRFWIGELSSAWVAGAPRIAYELPDLTGIAGFAPAQFALAARQEVSWSVRRLEDNGLDGDGRIARSAAVSGTAGELCGDGVVNGGEACDERGDTASCDADCTPVACGDGHRNEVVEACDPPDGVTCSPACRAL